MIVRMAWTLALLGASSCATYRYAKDMRLVSFENDVSQGKSVGQIEGDDCVWHILGYQIGGAPTVSRALANARVMRKSEIVDVLGGSKKSGGETIRYMNNVATSNDGFDAGLFGKRCVVVTGIGYK